MNSILAAKFGINWHSNKSFTSPLPERLKTSITNTIRECTRDHGAGMTVNHIVSGLSLGFWSHLMTSNFEPVLWTAGIQTAFPLAPNGTTRQAIYDKIDQFRNWRNRIAHHGAIFDKRPMKELNNVRELLSWICPETLWFMDENNTIHRTLGRKPVK